MREISSIAGVNIVLNINNCAHQCRYCFFDNQKKSRFPFHRFLSVVERFIDWKQKRGMANFDIPFVLFHCDDYDLATLKKTMELEARCGSKMKLFLGGLQLRTEDEMRTWLQERRDLGIKSVVASFAGYGEVHDQWNGRPGDFDFLMNTLKIAGELGLKTEQRLFLTRSTLPLLDELIIRLDELPGKVKKRSIEPLSYSGRAACLEDERVTATDLESLSERVNRCFEKRKTWRSEKDWMDFFRQEDDVSRKVILRLWLDDSNIEQIERMSCEEIVGELEARSRAAYAALPTRLELCEDCGDAANNRIYPYRQDIERKWLNRYMQKHPIQFERHLTHLSMEDMTAAKVKP